MLEWLAEESRPTWCSSRNTLLSSLAPPLKRELKRPIHCTLTGEDLFLDGLTKEHRTESLELIRQNAVSVAIGSPQSASTTPTSWRVSVDSTRKIDLVPLGINLAGFERRRDGPPDRPFTIGYLARIAPEKGLLTLCEGYERFRQMPGVDGARLEVAGYLAPDQQNYLKAAQRRLDKAGLGGEFQYRGALDRARKIDFLRGLDVFSVPTVYVEPKGLFLLEAMACGVPVVEPRHGAFPEMIAKTSGGVLVEPEDPQSLAEGLHHLFRNPAERARLGQNGFDGVRRHYSVARSADRMLEVYAC